MLLGFLIGAIARHDQQSEDVESARAIAQEGGHTSPAFLPCRFCLKKKGVPNHQLSTLQRMFLYRTSLTIVALGLNA